MMEVNQVICGECGSRLSYEVTTSTGNILIEPCEECLSKEEGKGFDRGFDDCRGG